MRTRRRRLALVAAGVMAALSLSACGGAAPSNDYIVLHYEAGSVESTKFAECVTGGSRGGQFSVGDRFFYYPMSIRFWDTTGTPGADAKPIVSVSDDNAEMLTPVVVNFRFINDCELIRQFHENLGNRSKAYFDNDSTEDNEGWRAVIGRVVGAPLETIVDRTAQQYNWRVLWNDPKARVEMQRQVLEQLPTLVKERTGGVQYFDGWTVTVNQPSPRDEKLLTLARDEQNNIASANAAKAKAEADKATAESQAALANAQVAVAKAEAAKTKALIDVIGTEAWLKQQAIEKGINPYPSVVGGTPLVGSGTAAK